jgi:hypothetical protein
MRLKEKNAIENGYFCSQKLDTTNTNSNLNTGRHEGYLETVGHGTLKGSVGAEELHLACCAVLWPRSNYIR